ncbi:uncharacterized protein LOC114349991 [Ostrinia furnacalis]|uniref:uncharacterized protein LOC114349991 n=1 Tax=Ostrinia furnacalis TaxID=93504 RepID=UPI0010395535|nr:uncharacterized protein LOC114349991 [Ostrinia furnacalis]
MAMEELNPDVMAINETWLRTGEEDRAPKLSGYRLRHTPRPTQVRGGRGGGVGFYIRKGLNVRTCPHPATFSTVEQMWVSLRLNNQKIAIGTAYRPPWQDVNVFLDAIAETIASFTGFDGLVILGDFNINLLDGHGGKCRDLINCMHSLNLKQLVSEPTHYTAHSSTLIDVICTDIKALRVIVRQSPDLGGHAMLMAELRVRRETAKPHWVTYRPLKGIMQHLFDSDLSKIDWSNLRGVGDIDARVEAFTGCIRGLIDLHAPIKTRKFKHPPHPWITDTIREMMHVRENYHRQFKKTATATLRDSYRVMKKLVSDAIEREKTCFFNKHINSNLKNSKQLWKNLKSTVLPNKKDACELPLLFNDPDSINNHFLDVPGEDSVTISQLTYYEFHRYNSVTSFSLQTVNSDVVLKTITALKSNAQGCDGVTLDMILLTLPYSLEAITDIVNCSILEGSFPECWKIAVVKPLPKINHPTTVHELRPISILPCLSKILERIVCDQLTKYLETEDILPQRQSGFRKGFSTATALSDVVDHLLASQDRGMVSLLMLLDFSRAFDSINIRLLLSKLSFYGLDRTSVQWFHSYLTQRQQYVELKKTDGTVFISQRKPVTRGVPQGSILGPILYILYSADIINHITDCHYHLYADDLQLYISFPPSDFAAAISKVNNQLSRISIWCTSNCLVLNPRKSKFMLTGSPKGLEKLKDRSGFWKHVIWV